MKLRNLLVHLLFLGVCTRVICSSGYIKVNKEDNDTSVLEDRISVVMDTSITSDIIEQDIFYIAPKFGVVYLVWRVEEYPMDDLVKMNDGTTLTDGHLYTPMVLNEGTFGIQLKVPIGSVFHYTFWITKDKEGIYQNFWDGTSSGKTIASDITPIKKTVSNIQTLETKKSNLLKIGGWLLAFLTALYTILWWIQKKRLRELHTPLYFENILFLSLSLFLFHILARADILSVLRPSNLLHDPTTLPRILKGSLSDFLYILGVMLVFIIIFWRWKIAQRKPYVLTFFYLIIVFSSLAAFSNIVTVMFLGQPLNYQWLYYSDFLGSDEAKWAFQKNLSSGVVVNMVSLCISVFVLAGILQRTYQILTTSKRLMYGIFLLVGPVIFFLLVQAFVIQVNWSKGQSENAITSFIHSMITAEENPSFFTIELPESMQDFEPSQHDENATYSNFMGDSKVKNVLYIVLESAGASYFDGYGGTYQLSPNLNSYAGQAMIFNEMYACSPATNRSLVSLLACIYPNISYKSLTQEDPNFDFPTISSILKSKGYRTSFFSSANLRFQNSNSFLSNRGFDHIEDFTTIRCPEQFKTNTEQYSEGNGMDDMCLSDGLTSWLDEDLGENFFSVIWTVQGHFPYFFNLEEEDFGVNDVQFNRYLNALKYNDQLIGKVLDALKDRDLASSTLVVVTGDHGEAFGQHRQFGHGTFIYEENLKVPLYLINPILFHGERRDGIAGMKDVATTTLSLLNIDIPEKWQGRDLVKTNSDEAFFFAPWSDYLFGYRKGNMKYIFNETLKELEVYNLKDDPNENSNLFDVQMQEEVNQARFRVAAWVQHQEKFIKQIRQVK